MRAQRRTEAEHAASRVLAEATNVESAAADLVRAVGDALGWRVVTVWLLERRRPAHAGDVGRDESMLDAIRGVGGDTRTFGRGEGLVGEAWASARAGVGARRHEGRAAAGREAPTGALPHDRSRCRS